MSFGSNSTETELAYFTLKRVYLYRHPYVFAQVLVSPVLAGIAVSIGVPILLFYVYGVVPVSLCRSGGCGVSTSAAGVRFDFDDENEMSVRNTGKGRFPSSRK